MRSKGGNMKLGLTIAVCAAFAPLAGAQFQPVVPVDKVVPTTLDAIRKHPDAYKGVWVSFPVQFCSVGKLSNPFFTRFVPSLYTNFYAWSDDQPIWRRAEWRDVCGTLVMAKDSDHVAGIYDLDIYDRLMLTGVVRNTFQSKPWIEIVEFEPLEGKVSSPTLAHMYRGESFMQRRQWNRAVSELALASAGDVPTPVLAAVHENLGMCYLKMGEADRARQHLAHAVDMRGDSITVELEQLWRVANNSPELQLDREVEAVEVGDHERPMWEAFEDAAAVPLR